MHHGPVVVPVCTCATNRVLSCGQMFPVQRSHHVPIVPSCRALVRHTGRSLIMYERPWWANSVSDDQRRQQQQATSCLNYTYAVSRKTNASQDSQSSTNNRCKPGSIQITTNEAKLFTLPCLLTKDSWFCMFAEPGTLDYRHESNTPPTLISMMKDSSWLSIFVEQNTQ